MNAVLVDSHCHPDRFRPRDGAPLEQVLARARARGVVGFLAVGVDLESSRAMVNLAGREHGVFAAVGVHPLQEVLPPLPEPETLADLAQSPGVVAVGETGLDHHYGTDWAEWQRENFARHLEAARLSGLPVVVHTREARRETLELLRHYAPPTGGVLHCFTETWEMARSALDLGFYLSFSGIITFRNAAALREVVARAPLDRILVETDSPYLAPVPHRGKPNEPAYVVEVAAEVARIKGLDLEEVARATCANFERLFGVQLGGSPAGPPSAPRKKEEVNP